MKTNQISVQGTVHLPLVEVKNQQAVTTSLQIAKIFGKEHFNVLESIRSLECSPNFKALSFQACFYINELRNGVKKELPMYYITRDGFTFLAMGFTGKKAAKFKEDYINAFNEMERRLREAERRNSISPALYDIQLRNARSWQELYYRSQEQLKAMAKNLEGMSELLRDSYERQYRLIATEPQSPKAKPASRRQPYYTIIGYASLTKKKVDRTQASVLGRKASTECRRQSIEPRNVESVNFGTVQTYPADVLKQVFTEYFGN